jgi:fatty acid synthase subunit alpha, fungi type
MRPDVEQELAHTLLVELLAYQFASPVRWIETQDVIFAEKRTERIVEIGPADTLGGMARRTLASKYEAYDAATSVQRQILCYNKDAKEIYYDVDPVEEEPESAVPPASDPGGAPATVAPAVAAAPVPGPGSGPAAAVADEPVAAVDILRALIAQKLKKSLSDVPLTKAIKDLVGGKPSRCGRIGQGDGKLTGGRGQANQPCRMRFWGT